MLVANLITQESKKVDVNFADIQSEGFADKRVSSYSNMLFVKLMQRQTG